MALYLGIDIGTTSIASVIIDKSDLSTKSVYSTIPNSYIRNEEGFAEQDVNTILLTIDHLMSQHPANLLHQVKGIGVTGQMHGILLWNKTTKVHSNLITWQDMRASTQGILTELQKKPNCSGLRDGFGFTSLATLYYNQQNNIKHNEDEIFDIQKNNYNCCGTIMDYLVWMLTGCPEECFIDYTNAASWGLFDISKNEWDREAVKSLGIDYNILPKVRKPGSVAGELCSEYREKYHIDSTQSSIFVKCAIGDNQASVVATGKKYNEEIYVTFGTGTQLSIVIDKEQSTKMEEPIKYELRPFPFDKLLIVTAPLSGGHTWVLLKNMTKDLLKKFDTFSDFSDSQVFDKLDELALAEINSVDLPQVLPHFSGERWDPYCRGSIYNLTPYNFTIEKIAAATLIGMALNLKDNIPIQCFENHNVIVGNGTFIRKSEALRKAIEKVFGLPLVMTNIAEEAATGAAVLASM